VSVYAQISDVAARFEHPISDEATTRVLNLIEDAETELELVAGDIAARITDGKTTAERVRVAVCSMVLRALRNPGGHRQQSAGPYSFTVDRAVASGRLTVTRRERRLLGLTAGGDSVSLSLADDALEYLLLQPDGTLPTP
jgi:hypothetical protein